MSLYTSPCGEVGFGPSGMTSYTQFLDVSQVRTKKLSSGVIIELPFKAAFMDRALIFMSQNDMNHTGNFSRGQPHHFQ